MVFILLFIFPGIFASKDCILYFDLKIAFDILESLVNLYLFYITYLAN